MPGQARRQAVPMDACAKRDDDQAAPQTGESVRPQRLIIWALPLDGDLDKIYLPLGQTDF